MRLNRLFMFVAISSLVSILPTFPASAAVISPTVFTDDNTVNGNCTLREAIRAANENTSIDACPTGNSGPDEIRLSAGTYRLTISGPAEDLAASGDLDITRDTLTIIGAGRPATVIDAGEEEGLAERVFHIGQFETGDLPIVSMSGLTITGGWANSPGQVSGGGIFLRDGAQVDLTDVRLIDNYGGESGSGGAIQAEPGVVTLTRVEVADNSTTTAGSAAGIALINSSATIVESAIHDNRSMFYAGGIATFGSGELTIRDSTISGNTAVDDGGGLFLSGSGTASLDNVTVTGNVADSEADGNGEGGGIGRFGQPVSLRNTIVAENDDRSPSGNQPDDCFGTIGSEGHNLIGNDEGCTITPTTGDQIGTIGSPIDPKLAPIADNGGPTPTHALLPGSPAIDGGEAAPARSGGTGCDAADQRGAPRSGTCDIGAYELVCARPFR